MRALDWIDLFRRDWSRNYGGRAGLGGALRCARGELALRSGRARSRSESAKDLEVVTFSVVPWLTALWGRLLSRVLDGRSCQVLLGDCSGGLRAAHRRLLGERSFSVLPCLNWHHGEKLDLFFRLLCRSEHVLVCDDDVFWLSDAPLEWALEQMQSDEQVAAVSLAPRRRRSSLQEGRLEEPMGSSCVLIRGRIWRQEELSFKSGPAPDPEESDWFFDTGDRAELELLERGYRVLAAPVCVREELELLEGMSTWILKLNKHSAGRLPRLADIPIRREKALQAALAARLLGELLSEMNPGSTEAALLTRERIDAAEASLKPLIAESRRRDILGEVERKRDRIRAALASDRVDEGTC